MTAIHSAWFLNNTHAAQEAATAAGLTFPPSYVALTALVAHTAFRTGRVTLTQPSMAEAIGAGERSIAPMLEGLVSMGILERRSPGHYRLGPFWSLMQYEEQTYRFQPTEPDDERPARTRKEPAAVVETPDEWAVDFMAWDNHKPGALQRVAALIGTEPTASSLTAWARKLGPDVDPWTVAFAAAES